MPSDVIYDLRARHTRTTPVFVIGYARSGTSLLCRLLRRYLKVSFGTESQFIIRYLHELSRYGDLHQDDNVRRLIADIATERFFVRSRKNWGFAFDCDKAFLALEARTYSSVLDAIFGQLAEHNQMGRWGDKTPQYNNHLELLRNLFRDAQFIHVVRDGRDVALSIRQTSFGPTNACATGVEWTCALRQIERFSRELPANQFFEVFYEDLITRPAEGMAALAEYLGIDDSDGLLGAYVREHIGGEVRSDNHGKWRHELQPRDVERFEAVAGTMLAHLGYELAFRGNARAVSQREQLYWWMRGRAARLIRPAAWSDNWYKLSLRARTVLPRALRRDRTPLSPRESRG
jgi:sulfotransferase family protein